MKTSKLLLFYGVSLLVLSAGCTKQQMTGQSTDGTIAVNITAALSDDTTKTSIALSGSKYKPSWTTGDALSVYTAKEGTTTTIDKDKTFTVGAISSGIAAGFSGSIATPSADATYNFYATYPKSDISNDDYTKHKVTLPTDQYPTLTSFDPAADILTGASVVEKAVTTSTTNLDLNFPFTRKTAVLRITPAYTSSTGGVPLTAKIASLKIDLGVGITGRVRWDLSDPTAALDFYSSTDYKKTYANAIYGSDKPSLAGGDVFLSIAPTSLSSGSIAVTIVTDGGYSMTKTFTDITQAFTAGNVVPVKLKVDGTWTIKAPVKKTIDYLHSIATGEIGDNLYIEGTVLNAVPGSCSSNGRNLVIQDNTTFNSGITIYLNDGASNTFAQGDKVRCYLLGSELKTYNDLLEVIPSSDGRVSKVGTSTLPTAQVIGVDYINDYQSMYVSIEKAQTGDGATHTLSATKANTVAMISSAGSNCKAFNLYVPYGVTALDGKTVPSGNGTLTGIAYMNSSGGQIIPIAESGFSGLTGTRTVTFDDLVFAGTMQAGVALSGCTITIPVNDLTATTTYTVTVTPISGATGISAINAKSVSVTTADKQIQLTLSGTPTTAGVANFAIEVRDAANAVTYYWRTMKVTIATAGYTWTLASGDLGSATTPATSASKGTPALTWTLAPVWKTATKYFGYDSAKGIQIGKGSNPATSYTLSAPYSSAINKITVNASVASGGNTKLKVSVDGIQVGTEQTLTTTATDYNFVLGTPKASGTVKIELTNTGTKAEYLKSIAIQ